MQRKRLVFEEKGLIHSKSAASKQLGTDGLDMKRFLVFMCPAGYLAYPEATMAVHANGIALNKRDNGWEMAQPPSTFQATPTDIKIKEAKEDPADSLQNDAGRKRSSIFGTAPDPLLVAAKMTKMAEKDQEKSAGPTIRRRATGVRGPTPRATIG
jgi:hypothetical protein